MSFLWINGTLIDKADAKVSPFDHGFLYGDGVWEPLRVFNRNLFRPADHLKLLYSAAESLRIDIPLSRDDLTAAIEATVRANDRTAGYVRVIVTRGPGTVGPDPRKIDPQVIIIAEEYQPFPPQLYDYGLHAIAFPVATHGIRTLGQPHVALAKGAAVRAGCLEALFVNPAGELLGSTEGMLFLVKDGALVVAGGRVPEATGSAVAATAGEGGLVVVEYAVRSSDLHAADEAFIAGTACGVIAVVRVDDKDIGTGTEGPVTRTMRERYRVLTRGAE